MDPIANMLTAMMNAGRVKKKRLAVPYSSFKKDLLQFMHSKGLIGAVRVQESPVPKLVISLQYDDNEQSVLKGVKRLSKPGARYYVEYGNIPYKYQGVGMIVISTSKGLVDDKQARKQHLGGELICALW